MPSQGHLKRLRRIERRASQAIKAALAAGRIAPRFADQLLYLCPTEQTMRLERRLATQDDVACRSRIAAKVIKEHIDGGRIDLQKLQQDLRIALSSSTIQTHA